MIILDTNIVAELMRPEIERAFAGWLDTRADDLWLNSVSVYETRYGLARMPEGSRRRTLEQAFERLIGEAFANRIAVLDRMSAEAAGRLHAACEQQGRSMEFRDILIGGIVLARSAILATRNIRHFQDRGIRA